MKTVYQEDIVRAVNDFMVELHRRNLINSTGQDEEALFNNLVETLEEHFNYPDYKNHN